eukprot:200464-Pelagomonas_calceolata.AAC.3
MPSVATAALCGWVLCMNTQELGNTDDFDISVLEQRLAKSDIIDYEWPAQRPKAYEPPKAIRKGGAGFQRTESDEDSDLD